MSERRSRGKADDVPKTELITSSIISNDPNASQAWFIDLSHFMRCNQRVALYSCKGSAPSTGGYQNEISDDIPRKPDTVGHLAYSWITLKINN